MFHCPTFPGLVVSYTSFVEFIPSSLVALCAYLNTRRGQCSGIQFIDSTLIIVCNNKRIFNHKVFDELTQRGKNTVGCFFGFKLHIVVSDTGDLLAFKLSPANTDDREPGSDLLGGLVGNLLPRKRSIVETINDQFKNISQIERTRHRSIWNFMVNLLAGLIAYTH